MATTSSSGSRRARARALGGSSPRRGALTHRDLRRGAHGCRGRCDLRRCLPPAPSGPIGATGSAAVLRATRLGTTRAQRSQSFVRGAIPDWNTERRRRSCGSPHQLLATCSRARGLDTTPREAAWALGITKRSTSQISHDGPQPQTPRSEPFAPVPQTATPPRSCWADALVVKVREAGGTANVHVLVVTGVNALGPPERSSASRSPPARMRPAGSLAGARSWHEGSRGWCS